jgi:hypothetical protein
MFLMQVKEREIKFSQFVQAIAVSLPSPASHKFVDSVDDGEAESILVDCLVQIGIDVPVPIFGIASAITATRITPPLTASFICVSSLHSLL